ncbi:Dual specificity protein phosphatase 9 [Kappamyces sp. JEL0680]|nr:Dual specificity protein phosphatase 9 [Kappamyces sp. JEL0680]
MGAVDNSPPTSLSLSLKVKSVGKVATDQLSASPSSPQPNSSTPSALLPLPSFLQQYIQSSKIHAISPLDLSRHLGNAPGEVQDPKWHGLAISMLLVDMRPLDAVSQYRLAQSINPSFPALVTKRFKKKVGLASFSLGNFLASPEDQATYQAWKDSDNTRKAVVVYDEGMENYEGDAWAFLCALADGVAGEMASPAPVVAYLRGGLSSFLALPGNPARFLQGYKSSSPNLYSSVTSESEEERTARMLAQSMVLGGSGTHSPAQTESTTNSSPGPLTSFRASPLNKATRSLSIDVTAQKKKLPSLSLNLAKPVPSVAPGDMTSPLSSASPNDNAAPPEPYSRITPNILIGSDVLPLAPNGPQLMSTIGVTHILNMAAEIKNSKVVEDSQLFSLKWIPVMDNTEVDLDDALQEAIDFIGDAVANNPRAVVFVHCKAGRSRSVSAVIGYLVARERHTLKTAYDLVRKTRKGVSPNLGFMAALLKVEQSIWGENSKGF